MITITIPATSFDYFDMDKVYARQGLGELLSLHCKLRDQAYAEISRFPAKHIERAYATTRVIFDEAVERGLRAAAEQLVATYPQIKAEVQALVDAGEWR